MVESNEKKESEKKEEKANVSKSFLDLIREESSESLFSLPYPTNHRYENCADCEDEFEDIDLVESEFADDEGDVGGDNQTFVQEESSGHCFLYPLILENMLVQLKLAKRRLIVQCHRFILHQTRS